MCQRSPQFHPVENLPLLRLAFAVLLFFLLALLAGCSGGSSSSDSSVTVSISPAATTLTAGQTASFVATVSNTDNTAVTWKVNGVDGGNSTYGTISASGLYNAPGTVSSTQTVIITAVSSADATVSGSATVTLNPSTSSGSGSVTVTPSYAVLAAGSQQTFVATASGTSIDVVWTLSCKASVSANCGTISSTGVYTAPLSPPPGANVMLTATAKDGSTNPGYSTITIQYSNATLAGQYAFSFTGENGSTAVAELGSVTLDGAGNIVAGVEDSPEAMSTISGGTYHIGTDGRGTATLQTSSGTAAWQFVVVDHATVLITSQDNSGATMTGALALQNPSQFDIGVISGNYTFALRCPASAQAFAQVGTFTADGAGNISQGLLDVITSGQTQSALSVTGSLTAPSSSGRGTLTLSSSFGTQTVIYYLVDSTHLKLMEQSSARAVAGDAVKQANGPFTVANITGKFATALYGSDSLGAAAFGAQFRLDGVGAVSAEVDSNLNGNVVSNVTMSGSYNVTDTNTGRTELTLNGNGKTYSFVAYPASGQDLYLAETDGPVAAGQAFAQQGFVITTGSLAGSFATSLSGNTLDNPQQFESATGQLVINGGGAITGTIDIISGGAVTSASALTASYFVDGSGYVTVTYQDSASALSSGTLALYPIDAQRFLSIEIDGNRVLTGFSEIHN